jgi:3-methylcrotonyl-CoA carboxylase alpha subunit
VLAARAEAKNAFGNDQLLVEKYLVEPRHIELQVFSDTRGNHVHLFERECSIQRRYQKIIEESPSPVLPEKTRAAMVEAALRICTHIGYVGAGTVEFIVDNTGAFYFLEMNTRLQVEHPVTEMVTGLDLVRMQLEVAQGLPLAVKQADIVHRGHAIEVRLYAEDPARDFMPAPGMLQVFVLPQLPLTRAENGYAEGNEVSASYDPMIAKLVAWGETRTHAIARMQLLLSRTRIGGVKNNRAYLQRILAHPQFVAGNTTTHFVKTYGADLVEPTQNDEQSAAFAAAFMLATSNQAPSSQTAATEHSAWNNTALAGWR